MAEVANNKIKWTQPKYMIPLIALPFIMFFTYMFGGVGDSKKVNPQDTVRTDRLATDIPDVSKDVDTTNLKSKFDIMQQRFKHQSEVSHLANIEENASLQDDNQYVSGYSDEERASLQERKAMADYEKVMADNDRIQRKIIASQRQIKNQGSESEPSDFRSVEDIIADAERKSKALNNNQNASKPLVEEDIYAQNMKIFKEQMNYMDSLQNPDKYKPTTKQKQSSVQAEKALPVRLATSTKSTFNTVRSKKDKEKSIMAIVDDDQTSIAGDRIRLKLLSDIYIGDYLLKSGSFIYGYISGFQSSRVNVSVEQIMYDNRPVKVNMSVYDNDGYLGLYVPSSNFREFTKQLGTQSTQGIGSFQMSQGEESTSQFTQGLLRKFLTSSGQSLGRMISKNKVTLKYNYIIYLVDNSKN